LSKNLTSPTNKTNKEEKYKSDKYKQSKEIETKNARQHKTQPKERERQK
jgi:hypothetical protein